MQGGQRMIVIGQMLEEEMQEALRKIRKEERRTQCIIFVGKDKTIKKGKEE